MWVNGFVAVHTNTYSQDISVSASSKAEPSNFRKATEDM